VAEREPVGGGPDGEAAVLVRGVSADRAGRPGLHTRGKPRLLDVGRRIPARDRFAPDSPLEERRFELPVPLAVKTLLGDIFSEIVWLCGSNPEGNGGDCRRYEFDCARPKSGNRFAPSRPAVLLM